MTDLGGRVARRTSRNAAAPARQDGPGRKGGTTHKPDRRRPPRCLDYARHDGPGRKGGARHEPERHRTPRCLDYARHDGPGRKGGTTHEPERRHTPRCLDYARHDGPGRKGGATHDPERRRTPRCLDYARHDGGTTHEPERRHTPRCLDYARHDGGAAHEPERRPTPRGLDYARHDAGPTHEPERRRTPRCLDYARHDGGTTHEPERRRTPRCLDYARHDDGGAHATNSSALSTAASKSAGSAPQGENFSRSPCLRIGRSALAISVRASNSSVVNSRPSSGWIDARYSRIVSASAAQVAASRTALRNRSSSGTTGAMTCFARCNITSVHASAAHKRAIAIAIHGVHDRGSSCGGRSGAGFRSSSAASTDWIGITTSPSVECTTSGPGRNVRITTRAGDCDTIS